MDIEKLSFEEMFSRNPVSEDLLKVFGPGDQFITTVAQALALPQDKVKITDAVIAVPVDSELEMPVIFASKVTVLGGSDTYWTHKIRSVMSLLGTALTVLVTTGSATNKGTVTGVQQHMQVFAAGKHRYSQAKALVYDADINYVYPAYILYPTCYEPTFIRKSKKEKHVSRRPRA